MFIHANTEWFIWKRNTEETEVIEIGNTFLILYISKLSGFVGNIHSFWNKNFYHMVVNILEKRNTQHVLILT